MKEDGPRGLTGLIEELAEPRHPSRIAAGWIPCRTVRGGNVLTLQVERPAVFTFAEHNGGKRGARFLSNRRGVLLRITRTVRIRPSRAARRP